MAVYLKYGSESEIDELRSPSRIKELKTALRQRNLSTEGSLDEQISRLKICESNLSRGKACIVESEIPRPKFKYGNYLSDTKVPINLSSPKPEVRAPLMGPESIISPEKIRTVERKKIKNSPKGLETMFEDNEDLRHSAEFQEKANIHLEKLKTQRAKIRLMDNSSNKNRLQSENDEQILKAEADLEIANRKYIEELRKLDPISFPKDDLNSPPDVEVVQFGLPPGYDYNAFKSNQPLPTIIKTTESKVRPRTISSRPGLIDSDSTLKSESRLMSKSSQSTVGPATSRITRSTDQTTRPPTSSQAIEPLSKVRPPPQSSGSGLSRLGLRAQGPKFSAASKTMTTPRSGIRSTQIRPSQVEPVLIIQNMSDSELYYFLISADIDTIDSLDSDPRVEKIITNPDFWLNKIEDNLGIYSEESRQLFNFPGDGRQVYLMLS